MLTAQLVSEFLPQFCPITNHYRCSDGDKTWHLLITVPSLDSLGTLEETLGIVVPVAQSHLPRHVDVFLSDENGVVLDADMDPSNGMTPLGRLDGVATHDAALAAMGYQLI